MKLTKRDIAEGLGLTYDGEESDDQGCYYHTFHFCGKMIQRTSCYYSIDEAWDEAADKLLDPLVDYLLGNLDD